MVYILRFFFSSKCSLFYNSNVFGSCIIHILYTGCAKFKKNNSGSKRLTAKQAQLPRSVLYLHRSFVQTKLGYEAHESLRCYNDIIYKNGTQYTRLQ